MRLDLRNRRSHPHPALFGALLGALLGLAGCANEGPPIGAAEQAVVVCAEGESLFGIDVSHWQATVDWDTVAADGVEYAFIRVSDGVGTADREFERNWPEARRVGILRGVYQFFRVNQDPIEQADLLLTAMGALEEDDLPPVLDIETLDGLPASTAHSRMRAWLSYVESATGRTPIIYTGFYFWRDTLGNPDFAEYPLWIAQYGPVCPDIPDTWDRWAFHQTSSTGEGGGGHGRCGHQPLQRGPRGAPGLRTGGARGLRGRDLQPRRGQRDLPGPTARCASPCRPPAGWSTSRIAASRAAGIPATCAASGASAGTTA